MPRFYTTAKSWGQDLSEGDGVLLPLRGSRLCGAESVLMLGPKGAFLDVLACGGVKDLTPSPFLEAEEAEVRGIGDPVVVLPARGHRPSIFVAAVAMSHGYTSNVRDAKV
jgi:hypothetical protein